MASPEAPARLPSARRSGQLIWQLVLNSLIEVFPERATHTPGWLGACRAWIVRTLLLPPSAQPRPPQREAFPPTEAMVWCRALAGARRPQESGTKSWVCKRSSLVATELSKTASPIFTTRPPSIAGFVA